MYLYITDSGELGSRIPNEDTIFPGIPVEKRFSESFLQNCVYVDDSFVDTITPYTRYNWETGEFYEVDPPDPEPTPEPEPEIPIPSKQREEAYNTQATIPWDGEMLTVTQASQKWQYYAAEGNTTKTDELTALIAEAKAKIREQYPD